MWSKIKEFLLFEFQILLLIGMFWAATMFLPLYLTGSFDIPEQRWQSLAIMFGPYSLYFILRAFFLFIKSVNKAYFVRTVSFASEVQRRLAEEWLMFVLFLFIGAGLMAYPFQLLRLFTDPETLVLACFILFMPYLMSLVYRLARRSFFASSELKGKQGIK